MRTRALLVVLVLAACAEPVPCRIEADTLICPGGQAELPSTCAVDQPAPGQRRITCPDGSSVTVADEGCTLTDGVLVCGALRVPLAGHPDAPAEIVGQVERFGAGSENISIRAGPLEVSPAPDGTFSFVAPAGVSVLTFSHPLAGPEERRVLALPGRNEVQPVTLLAGEVIVPGLFVHRWLRLGEGGAPYDYLLVGDLDGQRGTLVTSGSGEIRFFPGYELGFGRWDSEDGRVLVLTGAAETALWVDLERGVSRRFDSCRGPALEGPHVQCLDSLRAPTGEVLREGVGLKSSPSGRFVASRDGDRALVLDLEFNIEHELAAPVKLLSTPERAVAGRRVLDLTSGVPVVEVEGPVGDVHIVDERRLLTLADGGIAALHDLDADTELGRWTVLSPPRVQDGRLYLQRDSGTLEERDRDGALLNLYGFGSVFFIEPTFLLGSFAGRTTLLRRADGERFDLEEYQLGPSRDGVLLLAHPRDGLLQLHVSTGEWEPILGGLRGAITSFGYLDARRVWVQHEWLEVVELGTGVRTPLAPSGAVLANDEGVLLVTGSQLRRLELP